MLLNSPRFAAAALWLLRVVFTGGERVPRDKAARWEELTGSSVLQLYGSNEAGPVSCTRVDDSAETRLSTAGRVVVGLEWTLLDSVEESTESGTVSSGQLAVRSPGAHGGYWQDAEANRELYTADGYIIMPDVVTVDDEHRVRVVGRNSDISLRGGRNISAATVEEAVAAHPRVDATAAVAVPGEVFGERAGVAVVLGSNDDVLTRDELNQHLCDHGLGKQHLPEYFRVVREMPVSAGGRRINSGSGSSCGTLHGTRPPLDARRGLNAPLPALRDRP